MNLNLKGGRWESFIACLVIISLPYDSLTYLLGFDPNSTSQTFPIVCLVSVVYIFILFFKRLHSSLSCNYLLLPLSLLIYLSLITFVNIMVEEYINIEGINKDLRIDSSLRQGASFFLGIVIFYSFYNIFKRVDSNKVQVLIIIGTIPTLLMCFYQISFGDFRLQGFSSEPSHLADYLVWIFLPACFTSKLNKKIKIFLCLTGLFYLALTFSITGYLKLLSVLFFYFIFIKKFNFKFISISLIIFLFSVFIVLNSGDNYTKIMLNSILDTYDGNGDILAIASITDRFFGLIGPFNLIDSIGGILGYGFGADSVYFLSMFNPEVASVILATKGNLPSLSSLQGKMFLYGGVFGYLIYLLFWYKSWRSSSQTNLARAIIPAIFFSSLFSLGPFFLPYTWYWLAQSDKITGDSRTVRL